MNRNQRIIVSITGIFLVLLILVGLTYGYFLTKIKGNSNNKSVEVSLANLKLVYNDGSDGVIGGELLEPSNTEYTKTFTVKNEGNKNVTYGVYLINVINTFERKEDIKYTMSCSTDGDIKCSGVSDETTFPSGIKELITNEIEPGKTHTYTFKFTYKDTGTDQSIDMNKELSAKIQIFSANGDGEIIPYEEGTLAYNIINNIINNIDENKTNFTKNLLSTNLVTNVSAETDKILSTAEDDYGTTYYFRGNINDNYIEFAGMCWRIVRIEGDGSVKLILASELTCSDNNLTTDSGYATDGTAGVKGTIIKTKYGTKIVNGLIVGDYANSSNGAKVELNTWLETKIINENDKDMLKEDNWCVNDLKNAYLDGNISGTIEDMFANKKEFDYIGGNKWLHTKTPSYICQTTGMSDEIVTSKIGLLTFDEVIYAGGGNVENTNYYLVNNTTNQQWFTISPSFHIGGTDNYFFGVTSGKISNYSFVNTSTNAIRPSITIKPNVTLKGGIGTIEKPYKI